MSGKSVPVSTMRGRVYQRIERCWLRGPKEYRVMRQVRDEFEQISRNHKGEAHG